jgi:hypothetical protein
MLDSQIKLKMWFLIDEFYNIFISNNWKIIWNVFFLKILMGIIKKFVGENYESIIYKIIKRWWDLYGEIFNTF